MALDIALLRFSNIDSFSAIWTGPDGGLQNSPVPRPRCAASHGFTAYPFRDWEHRVPCMPYSGGALDSMFVKPDKIGSRHSTAPTGFPDRASRHSHRACFCSLFRSWHLFLWSGSLTDAACELKVRTTQAAPPPSFHRRAAAVVVHHPTGYTSKLPRRAPPGNGSELSLKESEHDSSLGPAGLDVSTRCWNSSRMERVEKRGDNLQKKEGRAAETI
ncbi:hypothetical protein PCL_01979 [Purpureocillium lilacinum]|uniref:Uncharacterized protein n=1 Tax=Purpureocillium lilacinum TaxID=33203 RepID=A0A2U3E114_PURLI|nr:hypothetical protein PCL_01979 [Purpureocillium lilacinum]